jgi:hypothetical protein
MSGSRFLLPEDGITDELAVDIAARGERPVALTPGERRLAAGWILAEGGNYQVIAARLHMRFDHAKALADEVSAGQGLEVA